MFAERFADVLGVSLQEKQNMRQLVCLSLPSSLHDVIPAQSRGWIGKTSNTTVRDTVACYRVKLIKFDLMTTVQTDSIIN